ncbi:hypothetical protein SLEP1_g29421 [Rubroshorea leprosula]|uniref:CCHC-type domain-containing protein n=1 Tax=Rubroshorea leprosula TaxID=152421 RepID=A0AAV5K5A3_9ROSI|nr:hypothetical protein SLEP1_g29421 [Rubroshorea leprosula]
MQPKEVTTSGSSAQEQDLLARSVKKIKDGNSGPSISLVGNYTEAQMTEASAQMIPENHPSNQDNGNILRSSSSTDLASDIQMSDGGQPSYKEKLTRTTDSVALTFSTIPDYMDEESDIDDDPDDNTPIVLLSKAEKQRIRSPWINALIIKAFCKKTLGYNYLFPRIRAQWNPTGHWDFIDLGLDFFLVRFQDEADLHKVIFGGPWFVGPYFLTMRRWEPNFVPSEALQSFTTTAVWAQLPNLSADYYDPSTLQKIGNKVGNLLRVDAHTEHHTRGQYARICVQVDLSKPVVKQVRIGRHRQKVLYEGVNALCFNCGRIGHRNIHCTHSPTPVQSSNLSPPLIAKSSNVGITTTTNQDPQGTETEQAQDINSPTKQSHKGKATTIPHDQAQSSQGDYGPWLLVERRRPRRRQAAFTEQSEKGTAGIRHQKDSRKPGVPTRKLGSKIHQSQDTNGATAPSLIMGQKSNAFFSTAPPSQHQPSSSNTKPQVRDSQNPLKTQMKMAPWNNGSRPNNLPTGPTKSVPYNLSANPSPKAILDNRVMESPPSIVDGSSLHSSPSTESLIPSPFSSTDPNHILPLIPTSIEGPSEPLILDPGLQPPDTPKGQCQEPPDIRGNQPIATSRFLQIQFGEQVQSLSSMENPAHPPQQDEHPQLTPSFPYEEQRNSKGNGSSLRIGSNPQRRRHYHRRVSGPYQTTSVREQTEPSTLSVHAIQGDRDINLSSQLPARQNDGLPQQGFLNSNPTIPPSHSSNGNENANGRHVMDLKSTHSPSIMLIMETKLAGDKASNIASSLFPCYHVIDADGLAGGIWLLWDDTRVSIDIIAANPQAIHAIIKVSNHPIFSEFNWFFSGIYGRPQQEIRTYLWQELSSLVSHFTGPWVIAGDFNDVLSQSEKFGGGPINQKRVQAYSSCMNSCNMMDMGFVGGRFTWTNMQSNGNIIRERLDRFWCNPEWKICFPEATVYHLPRVHSDHNPVLLNLDPSHPSIGKRPFRMEKFWVDHPEFQCLVRDTWNFADATTVQCVSSTMQKAKVWSRVSFGNLFKRKKKILARLDGIHRFLSSQHSNFLTNLEKTLTNEYSDILKLEEDLWFMKARTNWLVDGDKNSRFFHVTALKHRSQNKIHALKDSAGNWLWNLEDIKVLCRDYFKDLFTSSLCYSFSDSYQVADLFGNPSNPPLADLANLPSEQEIWNALHCIKPFKAPGPDGVHPFFYQKFWDIVKAKICPEIIQAFATGTIPMGWNECLLDLIPKNQAFYGQLGLPMPS